jgi:hypothetical protein
MINDEIKTWKEYEAKTDCRDDLVYFQRMLDAGWEPHFTPNDRMAKRMTPDNIPHDPVSFKKGKFLIWRARTGKEWNPGMPSVIGIAWQVAELEDSHYVKHRGFPGIKLSYHASPYTDRFPESNGFIPDLKTVLELDAKGEL